MIPKTDPELLPRRTAMSAIPEDIAAEAREIADDRGSSSYLALIIARALLAAEERGAKMERARWSPAVVYFERYCQDEADDNATEWVGCSIQQHEDAQAFAAVFRSSK